MVCVDRPGHEASRRWALPTVLELVDDDVAALAKPQTGSDLSESAREVLSIPLAGSQMRIEVGRLSIDGVSRIMFGERIKVEKVACRNGEIPQCSGCRHIIEILQNIHADDQIERFARRPFCDIAPLVSVARAGVLAHVGGDDTHFRLKPPVPVAPITRSGTHFEYGMNRTAPPRHHLVHSRSEMCNFVHRTNGLLAVEASEVVLVES